MKLINNPIKQDSHTEYHGVLENDCFISCSDGISTLFQCPRENLSGKSILVFSPKYQADGDLSKDHFKLRIDAANNGLPQAFEWQFITSDGAYINSILYLQRQTKKTNTNHLVFHLHVLKSPTAKKETIRDSKLLLQQMLDNSTAVVYVKDYDGKFQFVNDKFVNTFNISEKEVVGKSVFDIFEQKVAEAFIKADRKVFESKHPMEFEENAIINGKPHTYLSIKFPLFNDQNQVYAVCGISTDITERKKNEDAFRNVALGVSGATYDNVFDAIVWHLAKTLEVDFCFIGRYYSDESVSTLAAYNQYKIIPNISYDLAGTPCAGVVGKDYLFIPQNIQQLYPSDGLLCQLELEAYAGFPLYDSKGNQQGLIAIGSRKPLTETKIIRSVMEIFSVRASAELERLEADEAKKISEEQYRVIFNASVDGIVLFDNSGQIIDVNPMFKTIHGYEEDYDFSTVQPSDIIPEDHFVMYQEYIQTVATEGQAHILGEGIKRDGSRITLDIHGVRMSHLGSVQLLTIVRDITEQSRAELALRKSEDRLRATFDAALDAIISMDEKGNIVEFNPAACACFGFSTTQVLGKPLAELIVPPRFREAHMSGMKRYLNTGKGSNIGKRIEITAMRANGEEFPAELAIDVTQGSEGKLFIGYMRDITERKKAEESRLKLEAQLRQAQKMETIGHLTGGIAHDFNNILTSILGSVVLAEEKVEKYGDEKLKRYLSRASRSGQKAKNLIQQMLTFSRGQRGEPRAMSLVPLIKESIKLLEASLPSSVEIETNLDTNCSDIMIDPVHLEQILMNLCVNARDAVQNDGNIQISLQEIDCPECTCDACRQSFSGTHVMLSVADNGSGISSEVLERMFEPFYSTKEVGKGSGMGLSTVHGIVHDYGGHIRVETSANKGSIIHILFTALNSQNGTENSPDSNLQNVEGPQKSLRGNVLVVDDELDVAEFMQDMLEEWGLSVDVQTKSIDALQKVTKNANQYDLIITDHTMPKLTGINLAKEIRLLNKSVPIILYTGYNEGFDNSDLESAGINTFILKPIDIENTFQQVKQLLRQ